ncbi:MAG: hypothetical protein B7X41_15070, partial [Microbacterium sp. 14-71-5]
TGIALGLVIGAAVMVAFTVAGTRMQRQEQQRRAEAEGATGAGPMGVGPMGAPDPDATGHDARDARTDQSPSGPSDTGA